MSKYVNKYINRIIINILNYTLNIQNLHLIIVIYQFFNIPIKMNKNLNKIIIKNRNIFLNNSY